MSDALLSPAVGATFLAGSLTAIAYSSRKLKENVDERMIPLMGVLGAFIFAAQMINFTIPGTGSSGHIAGGMILVILLGPYAAFLALASVLTIQALFFADGGMLALGTNMWNLGIYPCFIVYPLIYRTMTRKRNGPGRIAFASVVSAVVSLQMGAISVVFETLLSGRSELPFGAFASVMLPIHLIVGLIEGVITAGLINYVGRVRPEILDRASYSKSFGSFSPGSSPRKVLLFFLCIAIAMGGAGSWFASKNPDGLEWSIKKIYGRPNLPEQGKGVAVRLKEFQKKTAFLPDYDIKGGERPEDRSTKTGAGNSWPDIKPGTSISGIIGSMMVIIFIGIVIVGIKAVRRNKT